MVDWVSAVDVPGENKVKGGASDSPVFAESKVEHVGQVIGLVIADSPRAAQEGAAKVTIQYGHPKVHLCSLTLSVRFYVAMTRQSAIRSTRGILTAFIL